MKQRLTPHLLATLMGVVFKVELHTRVAARTTVDSRPCPLLAA